MRWGGERGREGSAAKREQTEHPLVRRLRNLPQSPSFISPRSWPESAAPCRPSALRCPACVYGTQTTSSTLFGDRWTPKRGRRRRTERKFNICEGRLVCQERGSSDRQCTLTGPRGRKKVGRVMTRNASAPGTREGGQSRGATARLYTRWRECVGTRVPKQKPCLTS